MKRYAARWMALWLCLGVGACQPHYQNTDRSAMNKIPLRSVCFGRYVIDLPTVRRLQWTQEYNGYEVESLQPQVITAPAFTAYVEKRRDELAAKPHDTEGHLLSAFDRKTPNDILILSRDDASAKFLYNVEYYKWLQSTGYVYKKVIENEDRASFENGPSPAAGLVAFNNYSSSSQSGFCIDDALVTGKMEGGEVNVSALVPGWNKVYISAGSEENKPKQDTSDANPKYSGPPYRTFYWLDDDKAKYGEIIKTFGSTSTDPQYPVKFEIIRRRELTIDGRLGQEAIWKVVDQSGNAVYKFQWETIDELQNKQLPLIGVDMKAGDNTTTVSTPPEDDLLALWDAVLPTLHKR